jgi:hypothetical protein
MLTITGCPRRALLQNLSQNSIELLRPHQFYGRNRRGELSSFFLEHLWPVLTVWSLLSISDHTLTIWCARLCRATPREQIVSEESFELNPVFQRQVDALQWVSLRFILALVATHILLAAVWLRDALSSNELYSFLLGALVSLRSAIHVRHVALGIEGGREHVRGTEL